MPENVTQGADARCRAALDDGEIVTTYVPLTGGDEMLYEVLIDEPAISDPRRDGRPASV